MYLYPQNLRANANLWLWSLNVALRTKCKKFAHKTQKGEESDSSGILAFFAYYYEMLRSRLV